ncbi:winged helix-turn-helix transcriptional regulator [Streptomyces sp. KAU_LT]|uniref:winged helix-turn-helix transcriptional regulator n=1 Tax=Streptomyces sp. KAU_LT TaxID=3046669 RepID=UPI0024B6DD58|nr:winged helix-turn-helix transcriptional regulator [Streptomyces sp. KAU_LT]MDI9832811.1 winged helix-turn-helix transcriptional regulator [Streptomyces sp. KAU_LT]
MRVTRTELPAHPPHVEYALTGLGRALLVPLRAVREWAESHVPDIERARAQAEAWARAGGSGQAAQAV